MDDMVLIGESKAQLKEWLRDIREKLREIGFDTHPEKTNIVRLKDGFLWLGYQYRLTETGKVVMTADQDRLKATRRKYFRLVRKCKDGQISREKVDESYHCWRECASKGDGHRMLRNMDKYYQKLWRDADAESGETPVSA